MTAIYRELADVLTKRTQNAGLRIMNSAPPPPLPDSWGVNLSSIQHHRCEEHRLVELPLILVMDVQIEDYTSRADGQPVYWNSRISFPPYWLVDARLIHDWVEYPKEPFRPVTPIEAACILAQHPGLGSVKSHLDWPRWGHPSVQVYRCPDRNRIVLSHFGMGGYNHHVAYCRYAISDHNLPVIACDQKDPRPPDTEVPAPIPTT